MDTPPYDLPRSLFHCKYRRNRLLVMDRDEGDPLFDQGGRDSMSFLLEDAVNLQWSSVMESMGRNFSTR